MTKTNKLGLSVFLLFAALNLSACATKPKQAVVEPVPSARATEQQSAPESVPVVMEPMAAAPAITAEQNAAAPVASPISAAPVAASVPVAAEAPAPKPVAKKHRTVKAPKVAEPAPVVKPEPVAAPALVPAVYKEEAKPTPAPVVSEPVQEVAEPGFLEQYWLWILGLVIVVIAVLWMLRKKDAQQG